MMELCKIEAQLKSILSERRFKHSLGVANEAKKLAEFYNADVQKAYLAGLVHDCAKEIPTEKMVAILNDNYGIIVDSLMTAMPKLLHGTLGACVAQSEFDIYDAEVLDAIRCHTTGKANMSMLAKIIYIADYIEPNRDFEGVDELRELTYKNIDKAIIKGINMTVADLIKRDLVFHTDTIHARNYLILHGDME
ncbi:MAG: bis(5'-nucleosyl)-tetraphosphatase (symmetrical) YqeK [Oscillospiraceae bacterium]